MCVTTTARILYAQMWKEDVPTNDERKSKTMDYTELAKLTARLGQSNGKCFMEERTHFSDYLKEILWYDKLASGI